MIKTVVIGTITTLLLAGCTIGYNRHGDLIVVPALPVTIELNDDRNYFQNGYYYHQDGRVWVYSTSRQGPWTHLPRSHYPRNVHYRGSRR
jgi:hypothetical protein